MKQEPNSRGLGIPRLQAGEQVKLRRKQYPARHQGLYNAPDGR